MADSYGPNSPVSIDVSGIGSALHSSRRKAAPRFRCAGCLVLFTPTAHESEYCSQCAAGRQLSHAVRRYQTALPKHREARATQAYWEKMVRGNH
jgi:hypothetical protein